MNSPHSLNVVLWDTRRNDAQKDFAGGMGVGMYPGLGGFRGRMIRRWYLRDFRPVAMNFAYMAAIFKKLGHCVRYVEDHTPAADVYVFNPSLLTLAIERQAMQHVAKSHPSAKILVIGQVAYALPEAFEGLPVTIIRGEPEKLLWRLDDAVTTSEPVLDVGSVKDLDSLPYPDWSFFDYQKFKNPIRFLEVSDGTHSAKSRLYFQLQLLSLHHRGKQNSASRPGLRG